MIDITGFKNMFQNVLCPNCGGSDMDFEIIRDEGDGICVIRIRCKICKKSFAIGIFGLKKHEISKLTKSEMPPITEDDVKKAKIFFNDFEKNWHDFLEKR